MPLLPMDPTPLLRAPAVAQIETKPGRPRTPAVTMTESGTGVVARVSAAAYGAQVVKRMLEDVLSLGVTGTVTYDARSLPVRAIEVTSDAELVGWRSRAFGAFKELGRWLLLNDSEVAHMVGVQRTTAYAWERAGHDPRPGTARRLMQHHAVVAAVVDRLGESGARSWLTTGSPSAVEELLAGNLEAIDKRVGELVFSRSVSTPRPGAFMPDDEEDLPPSAIAQLRGV